MVAESVLALRVGLGVIFRGLVVLTVDDYGGVVHNVGLFEWAIL